MRRTSSRLPSKSLIALVLVVISFLMMVFPWVNISIEVMGRDYAIPDLLDIVCKYEGISSAQFNLELQAGIASFAAELADETGVIMNAKEATNAIDKLLDGGVSLLDAATLCTYAGGLLKDIDQALNLNIASLSSSERVVMMMISEASSTLNIAAIVLWVMIAVLVITFAIAVFTLLTHKKTGAIVYTIAVAVPFIAVVIGVMSVNDLMQTYASYVTDAIDDILWMVGAGSYGVQNLELFHLSAASIISLICAIAATLIMVVTGIKIPGIKTPTVPNFKWTCACGFQNNLGNAFCSSCGQKRPEKPRCECGAVIVPGTKFCGKCGKPIESVDDDSFVPPPPTPKICPRCGSFMDGAVCRRCSSVTPQPRKCARCGAPVYGNNTVCESCSTSGGRLSGDLWNKAGDSDLE